METSIALNIVKAAGISYREVIKHKDGKSFLSNVNLIIGGKIAKKIRFNEGEIEYSKSIGEKIINEYLISLIEKDKKKKQKTKKEKVNPRASKQAAMNLMNDLGL